MFRDFNSFMSKPSQRANKGLWTETPKGAERERGAWPWKEAHKADLEAAIDTYIKGAQIHACTGVHPHLH
jgi:hypothetical protein